MPEARNVDEWGRDENGRQVTLDEVLDRREVVLAARTIFDRLEEHGIDRQRLVRCMDGTDNWGALVHACEYLTVIGVVLDAWAEADEI